MTMFPVVSRSYAAFQINYILGDSGRSWISGYGTTYPKYYWHKLSCESLECQNLGLYLYVNWREHSASALNSEVLLGQALLFESLHRRSYLPLTQLAACRPLLKCL